MDIKNLLVAQELMSHIDTKLLEAKKIRMELEASYSKLVETISKIDEPMRNSIEMSCHDIIRRVRDIRSDLDKTNEAWNALRYGLMDVIKSNYHESYYG